MGYTLLYTNNMERTVQLYHMMPDLIKAILVESPDTHECFEDEENCILSSRNPDGIPVWKIFSFNFWTGADHPLGRPWTLSPEEVSRSNTIRLLYSAIAWNRRVCHSHSSHTITERSAHIL